VPRLLFSATGVQHPEGFAWWALQPQDGLAKPDKLRLKRNYRTTNHVDVRLVALSRWVSAQMPASQIIFRFPIQASVCEKLDSRHFCCGFCFRTGSSPRITTDAIYPRLINDASAAGRNLRYQNVRLFFGDRPMICFRRRSNTFSDGWCVIFSDRSGWFSLRFP